MTQKEWEKVSVRVGKVVIPTYLPAPPDRNPMFLEKRVYQGSSGRVYPLPFTDRISEEKTDREWTAIYIENDFLEVMILPEIGGRIHAIYDKIRESSIRQLSTSFRKTSNAFAESNK